MVYPTHITAVISVDESAANTPKLGVWTNRLCDSVIFIVRFGHNASVRTTAGRNVNGIHVDTKRPEFIFVKEI